MAINVSVKGIPHREELYRRSVNCSPACLKCIGCIELQMLPHDKSAKMNWNIDEIRDENDTKLISQAVSCVNIYNN